jgi:uncharacterized protein (DUF1778 family)
MLLCGNIVNECTAVSRTWIGGLLVPITLRTQRTEARLLPDQKKRIERAARIKGVSLSDFIVQNADEAAIRTIQQYESWALEARDRDFFVEALLRPAEPSARLKSAAKRFRERVRAAK